MAAEPGRLKGWEEYSCGVGPPHPARPRADRIDGEDTGLLSSQPVILGCRAHSGAASLPLSQVRLTTPGPASHGPTHASGSQKASGTWLPSVLDTSWGTGSSSMSLTTLGTKLEELEFASGNSPGLSSLALNRRLLGPVGHVPRQTWLPGLCLRHARHKTGSRWRSQVELASHSRDVCQVEAGVMSNVARHQGAGHLSAWTGTCPHRNQSVQPLSPGKAGCTVQPETTWQTERVAQEVLQPKVPSVLR